ncbi:MAG: hypothetical protein OHK0015_19680 [Chloroflexi bacterium OHK40]
MQQKIMPDRVRAWWHSLPPPTDNPFQRRVYPLLFATIIALGALDGLGLLVSFVRMALGEAAGITAGLYGGLVALSIGGYWLARRGSFQAAVLLIAIGLVAVQALGLLASGLVYASIMLAAMLTSIVFAGLLLGWLGGSAITLLSVGLAAAIGFLEASGYLNTGLPVETYRSLIFSNVFVHACLAIFVLVMVVSFREALRAELARTQEQEVALRAARDSLQEQVAQQTVELRAAFEESEQRARELSSTLAALAQREATIRQLEAPIIPVMAGVILVPLIGQSGSEHMQMVGDRILAEIVERRAYDVIIDITSVSMIDTATAQQLLQLASSVRLVGARAVLVGIRPEVAQTIVSLGISLTMPTYATLEQAVTSLLKRASHSHAAA